VPIPAHPSKPKELPVPVTVQVPSALAFAATVYLAVARPGTASLLLHKAILIFPVNFFV
jgi:hypothetical protein